MVMLLIFSCLGASDLHFEDIRLGLNNWIAWLVIRISHSVVQKRSNSPMYTDEYCTGGVLQLVNTTIVQYTGSVLHWDIRQPTFFRKFYGVICERPLVLRSMQYCSTILGYDNLLLPCRLRVRFFLNI